VSDQAIRMVDLGKYDVGVGVVHRHMPGTQGAIEHSEITEVYHVLKGTGTFVTGGTIPGGAPNAPESQVVQVLNGPSTSGASIASGTSRVIKAGDVIIIPPNTPHWFANIDGAIEYLVIRFDPGKVVKLK
jgi:mannose-6-phosphate isomerase-like protein (cupin superfamily)